MAAAAAAEARRTSEAADGRGATIKQLIEAAARAEAHGSILATAGEAEAEGSAMRDAFALSSSELSASQEEHAVLLSRLAAARGENEEWQQRVRAASAAFEQHTREWRDQVRRPPAHSQPPSAAAPSRPAARARR